jgi:hypothetical protein
MRRVTESPLDRVSLAAGLACLLVGAVLGLDQLDVISLSPDLAAALICAAAGVVLVVSGLTPRQRAGRRGER